MYIGDVKKCLCRVRCPIAPEYQYHLKDHLGNVRTTFTAKEEIEQSNATVERTYMATERSHYVNYNEARVINSYIFDHTNDGNDPADVSEGTGSGDGNAIAYGGHAVRLSGIDKERIGLARSLSVMPGDKIDIEVWAKYFDPSQSNSPNLTALMNGVKGNGSGLNTGTVIDGSGYALAAGTLLPFVNALTKPAPTDQAPKAYLNWTVFDRDYKQDLLRSGYKRITAAALEDGTNNAHQPLRPDNTIEIAEPGYVYIWLSNENETPEEVYFDDFKITHTKSPVIQQEEYYPFGLSFNNFQRENSIQNKYLFNGGSELQTDLNLGFYSTLFRTYDPAIGRFMQIDPLADFFSGITPYNFAFDNPILYSDPDGLAPMWFLQLRANLKQTWYNVTGRGNLHAQIEGKHNGQRVQIGAPTAGERPTPNPRAEQVAKTYGKEEQKPGPVTPSPSPDPQPDSEPTTLPTLESTPDPIPTFRNKEIRPSRSINYSERIQFDLKTDHFSDANVVKAQLGDLVKLLVNNTGISVYIAGNSFVPDGIIGNGTDALNQSSRLNGTKTTIGALMGARARAVYNFLIGQGVNPKQLIYGTGNVMSGKGGLSVSFEIRNK